MNLYNDIPATAFSLYATVQKPKAKKCTAPLEREFSFSAQFYS